MLKGKNLACLIGGFLTGAGTGFFGARLFLEKTYKKQSDECIDEIRTYYENLKVSEKIEEAEKEETKEEKAPVKKVEEPKKKSKTVKEIIKDNAYSSTEPYLINDEDFGSFADYDEVYMTYYETDDVVAYENDELVADPTALIGTCWQDTNKSVAYVRNDTLKADYRIDFLDESFEEAIGYAPKKKGGKRK